MVVKQYASEDVLQALIESQKALVLSEQSADREIHRLRDLLSQSQKDLEIARKALEEIAKEHTGTDGKLYACSLTAQQALEQINHKES